MWILAVLAWPTPSLAQGTDWAPDVVIERFETHIRVTPDGRLETRQLRRIRLASPLAFNQLTDVRIGFDREFEELEIETARMLLPDGKSVELPDRARIITTPDAVASCPSFSQYNEWVLAMVGAEPGAVMELTWVVRDRASRRAHFEGLVFLGDRFPITEALVTLEIPARLPLERLAMLPNGQPMAEREPLHKAASSVWSWELKNIPASAGAPDTAFQRLAFVLFSTAGSWEKLAEPLQKSMAQAVQSVGPAILKTLEKELEATPSGLQRSVAIVQGIAQRMRRVGHEVVSVSLATRELATVWNSREATPLEVALLTVAALSADGVSAHIEGFLPFLAKPDATIPAALAAWGPVRIALKDQTWGELRFAPFAMEPEAISPAALGGACVVIPAEGRPVLLSAPGNGVVVAGLEVQTKLMAQGTNLKVDLRVKARGAANPWFRWGRQFNEAQAKAALANVVLEGIVIDSVLLQSFGPTESEFRVLGTLPATKEATLVDTSPLAAWLEPTTTAWMERSGTPCPGCSLAYRSTFEVDETALAFYPAMPGAECQQRSACVSVGLAQTDTGHRLERTLKASGPAGDVLSTTLAQFLAGNQSRSVLVWTGSK